MENGAIADAQISASSQYDRNSGPQSARLNGRGGWRPSINNRDQWLQVDLEKYTTVSRIATQGRSGSYFYGPCVTKYRLQYSDDGVNYHPYKARGQDSVKVRSVDHLYLRKVRSFLRKSTFEHKTSKFGHKMPNRWNWQKTTFRFFWLMWLLFFFCFVFALFLLTKNKSQRNCLLVFVLSLTEVSDK